TGYFVGGREPGRAGGRPEAPDRPTSQQRRLRPLIQLRRSDLRLVELTRSQRYGVQLKGLSESVAGMDGNRTHPGRLSSAPQTVLKTAEDTSPRSSPASLTTILAVR